MKPHIKTKFQALFQLAYDIAENDVEADNLYWNAYDMGIKINKKEDKDAVNDFYKNLKKITDDFTTDFGK